jgi:hypothetical protein
LFVEQYMQRDSATDAERAASERAASVCPECDAVPGSPHAPDCAIRPALRYQDYLAERYAEGDGAVFRVAGTFMCREELLDVPHQ